MTKMDAMRYNRSGLLYFLDRLKGHEDHETMADLRKRAEEDLASLSNLTRENRNVTDQR